MHSRLDSLTAIPVPQPASNEYTVQAHYHLLDRPLTLTIVRESYENPWLAILLLITSSCMSRLSSLEGGGL